MDKTKNKKIRSQELLWRVGSGRKGFTLLELMVSVFVFSLIMVATVAIFARFVTFQKRAQSIQRDMEDARYAMELMAKTLRTSSVLSVAGTFNSIDLYDYSQGKCIKYSLISSKINSQSAGPAGITTKADCAGATFSPATAMVGNSINDLTFFITPSASGVIGKVTISMVICSSDSSCSGTNSDKAILQTTVSLRDYVESNP